MVSNTALLAANITLCAGTSILTLWSVLKAKYTSAVLASKCSFSILRWTGWLFWIFSILCGKACLEKMIRFIRFCRSIEKKYVLNFRPYWTETAPSGDTRKRLFLVVIMKRAFLVMKSIVIYFGKSSKFQILQAIINVSKDSFSTTMCVFTAKLNNVAQINDIHEFTDDISKSLFFDCNWTSPLWNLNAK